MDWSLQGSLGKIPCTVSSSAEISIAAVAFALSNRVFAVLGTPKILHSDNGREFVNEIIHSIIKEWPGEVMVVNGRPRNWKCQGLIEQGNGMVEKLLECCLYAYEGYSQLCGLSGCHLSRWCKSTKYNCAW